MVYKGQFMSGLGVFSEGKHFMDMMPPKRRSLQAKHATVCRSGAAAVAVGLERARTQSRKEIRKQRTGTLQSRYMHLKTLKKVLIDMNSQQETSYQVNSFADTHI